MRTSIPGRLLQAVQDIEAAAAAVAPELVGAVGDALQFLKDEPGDDKLLVDDAGFGDVGDAAVDDDGGVEHERSGPLDLLGELDVGDDEAEVVLGLEQRRDADEADEYVQEGGEHEVDALVKVELHRGLEGVLQQVREEDADDQTDVDRRDRLDALAGSEHVGDDRDDCGQHDADEDDVRAAELALSDDPRRPDSDAAGYEHEDGPDEYEKHDKSPLRTFSGNPILKGAKGSEDWQAILHAASFPGKPSGGLSGEALL